MLVLPPSVAGLHETNLTAASRTGTTVTAGTPAGTKGAFASLIDPTDFPSYGIWIAFRGVHVAATVANMLFDIAYGPTGGGSEEVIIPNLGAGAAPTGTTVGACRYYYFPVYIPAGVRVSARCWANLAGDTGVVAVWLDQNPLMPGPYGRVASYGVDATAANARGTAITAGSGAFGTWTELLNAAGGSGLTRPHRLWTISMDCNVDTTLTDDALTLAEIGIGPNSGAVTRIAGPFQFQEEGVEPITGPVPLLAYAPVIVDATNLKLWVRTAAIAADIRGWIVYGID